MIREQRKKKRRRKIGLTVVLILLMLLAIAFLIVWKVFTVENVVVEGNELYSSEQIVEASQIQPGDNLLTVNKALEFSVCSSEIPHQGYRQGAFCRHDGSDAG